MQKCISRRNRVHTIFSSVGNKVYTKCPYWGNTVYKKFPNKENKVYTKFPTRENTVHKKKSWQGKLSNLQKLTKYPKRENKVSTQFTNWKWSIHKFLPGENRAYTNFPCWEKKIYTNIWTKFPTKQTFPAGEIKYTQKYRHNFPPVHKISHLGKWHIHKIFLLDK